MIPFFTMSIAAFLLYCQTGKQQIHLPSRLQMKQHSVITKPVAGLCATLALIASILQYGWLKGMIFSFLIFSIVCSLLVIVIPVLITNK